MTFTDASRHELAETMSNVARNLEAEPDEMQTLSEIVRAAVETVPNAAYGDLVQVEGTRITPHAPSDEIARQSDQAQDELQEGPCLDALREHQVVIVNDLGQESRWPRFAARVAQLGIGSMVSFRLFVREETIGALNLYGSPGAQFDEDARLIGEVFATHAALAWSEAREHRQLNQALATRDAIGQAKGMLMREHNITGQRAFDMLVQVSQESNRKVSDLADWLVTEHERAK